MGRKKLLCIVLLVIFFGTVNLHSSDTPNWEGIGGFGIITSFLPDFNGEIQPFGASLYYSVHTRDGEPSNWGYEVTLEFAKKTIDYYEISFFAFTGSVLYPLWIDKGSMALNLGITGQGSNLEIDNMGTYNEFKQFAIMPHVSLAYKLPESLVLKASFMPRLGDSGFTAFTLGVFFSGNP